MRFRFFSFVKCGFGLISLVDPVNFSVGSIYTLLFFTLFFPQLTRLALFLHVESLFSTDFSTSRSTKISSPFCTMFTPPPSPMPLPHSSTSEVCPMELDDLLNGKTEKDFTSARLIRQRMKMSILFLPVVLILVALSSWIISGTIPLSLSFSQSITKRSPFPDGTSSSPSPTTTVPQTQQTIPPAPDANSPPPLPTPFPQPFDSVGATTNLSTLACQAFFENMTQTTPFRSCRPLSLLVQSSEEFLEVSLVILKVL